MSFGDLKVQDLIYEDSSNNEITVVLADLATKNNPVLTGIVTVPTATAGDNSTKAASTAFVSAGFAPIGGASFTGDISATNCVLSGNLTVNGTTTTINTQTLDVEDKNIVIGKVSSPSDTTADGGGWTLLGSTNKTFNWLNATDSWTSSEHIEIASGKNLKVDGTTLFVDGTNNRVGILTTSPAEPLSVSGNVLVGDGSNGKHIRFSRSGLSAELIIGVDGYGNAVNNEATIQSGTGRPLVLMTNGAERLRIESSGATRLKNEYLRFQAANHAVSDFSQKVGLKWTYETDIEIAKIEISRPSWSGGPSDMLFHTCNTSGTVSERLRIGNSGQFGIGGANYGSSGQVLTSGGSGAAPSWANVPAGGNSIDLVADGAIAAGKPVIIKSNGKAEQVQTQTVVANPPVCTNPGGTRLYFSQDIYDNIGSDYGPNITGYTATGLTFNAWRESNNRIKGRFTKWSNDSSHDAGFGTATVSSSGSAQSGLPIRVRYVGDGYWLVIWSTGNGSNTPIKCRTIRYNGDLGVENTLTSANNVGGAYFDAVRISDTRTVVTWRQQGNGSIWGNDASCYRVIDWSGSGTSRTFSGSNDAQTGIGNHGNGQVPSLAYDSTNSKLVLVCNSAGTSGKAIAGTVSGSAGSGSVSWGSVVTFASGSDYGTNASVTYDSTNDKLALIYRRSSDGKLAGAAMTVATNNTITVHTKDFNWITQEAGDFGNNTTAVSSRGLFVRGFISNYAGLIAGGTISGNTFEWLENQTFMTNTDSRHPAVNYISAKDRFEFFREKTSGDELYGSQASASASSNNLTTNNQNFLGFAEDAISDGNTGTIKLCGNVVGNQSGLTPGTRYAVSPAGTLSAGGNSFSPGGLAVASDKLLIGWVTKD
tara:strand:- start:29 stop:2653 length:2625 start_codon:yes stop_codon:yes gene_type:complete